GAGPGGAPAPPRCPPPPPAAGFWARAPAGRGQSLIVWAIAEGRSAARGVDRFLTGSSALPYPIKPTDRSLMV
ncbi:hypothetical protein ACFXA3_24660, partial [Streptomyces sp. NPDC059456]